MALVAVSTKLGQSMSLLFGKGMMVVGSDDIDFEVRGLPLLIVARGESLLDRKKLMTLELRISDKFDG